MSLALGRAIPSTCQAGQREHVPLGHQVAGEEHGQRQLGELLRLDAEPAEGNLDLRPGTGHLADAAGQQRWQGEQHQPDGAERVGVPLQHARLADHHEHGNERDHPDRAPDELERGGRGAHGGDRVAWVAVTARLLEPVDHHQAEAVEQRRERQQQRVRPWGELADGQVRTQHQHTEKYSVGGQPGRHAPVQAQPDVRVGEQHDADGEREHDQFGPAPSARQRQSPGQARLGGHRPRVTGPVAGRPHSAHEPLPAPVPLVAGGPGQPSGVVGWVSLNCGAWTVPLFFGSLCGWRSPHFFL